MAENSIICFCCVKLKMGYDPFGGEVDAFFFIILSVILMVKFVASEMLYSN